MTQQTKSVAIYRQIIEFFQLEISAGRMKPGDRIDSIRNLALFFKVNPNTVQKALNELERMELVVTDRTNGKYVADNEEGIQALKHELATRYTTLYSERMQSLGLDYETVVTCLRKEWETLNHE